MTYEELENGFMECFASILTGLSSSNGTLRISYSQEVGPSWKHNENVLSFYLSPLSDVYDQDIFTEENYNEETDQIDRKIQFTNVIDVNCSFFGPLCRENARKLQVLIQKAEYREPLTKLSVFPVLKRPPVRYLPYEYNKQWWQRADLVLTFNCFDTVEDSINTFKSAVIKITDTGETRDVDITS